MEELLFGLVVTIREDRHLSRWEELLFLRIQFWNLRSLEDEQLILYLGLKLRTLSAMKHKFNHFLNK